MTDPRRTYQYQQMRRAWLPTVGDTCCICGGWVDRQLSGSHPLGPTVEHTIDVVHAPERALDVTLWSLAHRACNSRKGASLGGKRLAMKLGRPLRGEPMQPPEIPPNPSASRW